LAKKKKKVEFAPDTSNKWHILSKTHPDGGPPPTPKMVSEMFAPFPNPKYTNELKQLQEMGFNDLELLNDLLTATKGDMDRVFDMLSEFK